MLRSSAFTAALLLLTPCLFADKVIMKDGKIYEGRVIGESDDSVLITDSARTLKPRFLPLKEVMSIVKDQREEEKMNEDHSRFASAQLGTHLTAYSSHEFSFRPTAGIAAAGAFRVFPPLEIAAELMYTPELTHGELAITDGTTTRGYDSFYAWEGGFMARVFPFFKKLNWRMEPYLTTGYRWIRLTPKASGDSLTGGSIVGGAGVLIPWKKPLYWDVRFLYAHTDFQTVHFLTNKGRLSGVTMNTYGVTAALSWRFL